ncbi:neuronal growth regulator 1-like [Ctenocephalides felis]|uniref:neuronal growth regulator 1-like n=1 Tax=Ctenocephalides felis TaxID=7515 RepID=UPI000E6E3E09|nr:neuronal growth regulator 1-like [Ctenocephalides felis]
MNNAVSMTHSPATKSSKNEIPQLNNHHYSQQTPFHKIKTPSTFYEKSLIRKSFTTNSGAKALATNQNKNKTSNQHHSKHHHKNGKHKSPEMELEEISRKLDKVPRKYQNLEIININQGELQKSSDNLDKLVKHQHVDVSLIPSEQDFDQLFVNNNKTVFGDGKNESNRREKLKKNMFVSENCTVVLAQTGSTAQIHCEVNDVGENTVTWIRRRDYHLLTVGLTTYSSDERFFAAYGKNAQDVALHVRFARESDAGLYECQISSHPPTSLFAELKLVEAVADIVGGPDKIVKAGSPIRLTCHLRHSTETPLYVFWYHGERMINYDLGGGVTVKHGKQSSELVIEQADKFHAGNYTCVPSNARPASVNVHILQSGGVTVKHGKQSSELVIEQADKFHAGNYTCVPSNARPASVNVHILQSGGVTVKHGKQSSELVIEQADKFHAGNYTCVPSNARPASVNVHILQNEKPAAMQHGVSKSSAVIVSQSVFTCCVVIISSIFLVISS